MGSYGVVVSHTRGTPVCRLSEKEASAALLEWHGVLTEKAGMGCIMRALADRRAF